MVIFFCMVALQVGVLRGVSWEHSTFTLGLFIRDFSPGCSGNALFPSHTFIVFDLQMLYTLQLYLLLIRNLIQEEQTRDTCAAGLKEWAIALPMRSFVLWNEGRQCDLIWTSPFPIHVKEHSLEPLYRRSGSRKLLQLASFPFQNISPQKCSEYGR